MMWQVITLAVNNDAQNDLYNYVNDEVVPEFEKLSSVASVDISGGQKEYVKIELLPEKLNQYHLSMNAITAAVKSADFSYPVGSTQVGKQKLSVSTEQPFETMDSLNDIPLTVSGGQTVYLSDVAKVYMGADDVESIARYKAENGLPEDIVALTVSKQQDAATLNVSKDVKRVVNELTAKDPSLQITIVDDDKDSIMSSLSSVIETMVLAIIISMVIIWLFFGDLKASMIVGSSIPVSILSSLILMQLMGFSLNVITLSALVLGVGMMVDNSTVVLESCFRATDDTGFREFSKAALNGTGVVYQSVIGSTLTTCVVFLPLAMLGGMTGQMFRPLGFTIVFCMTASLISAITVVPLCYMIYRPKEKDAAPLSRPVEMLQNGYRRLMKVLLPKKKTVIMTSVVLLILSFVLAGQLGFELMASSEGDSISVSVETRPGLKIEEVDKILQGVEAVVSSDENVDSYMLSYGSSGLSMSGGSGATLTAYLKDKSVKPKALIKKWKPVMAEFADCDITMEEVSNMGSSTMTTSDGYEVILQSTQYDDLKAASDKIVNELTASSEVTRVHSTLENAAPLIKIDVDPVKAAAEGLSPAQVAGMVNTMLSGSTATTLKVNGNDIDVNVEYPDGEYDTLDQVKGIVIPTTTGASVALVDIADISYKDSPLSITRSDKQYQVTITGDYTGVVNTDDDKAVTALENKINREIVNPNLSSTVERAQNAMDERMGEELSALFQAVMIAIFLVFVVMAAQFESVKFSVMVMTTIPFALIGSFGFLFLANCKISMTSMLGFLMLVGTVVNSGILYVDTVNQYRQEMDLETALIEAGATRLRPILMTTLTTIVAMIPMCLAYGKSGKTMQGLALVDVGGLVASTILAMLMLPVYYSVMSRKPKKELVDLDD